MAYSRSGWVLNSVIVLSRAGSRMVRFACKGSRQAGGIMGSGLEQAAVGQRCWLEVKAGDRIWQGWLTTEVGMVLK